MAVKINPMRLTGMASGFDTDAIIKSLMQIEQLKLDRQLRSRTTLTWKQDAISAVQTKVNAFRNKYISMLSPDNIMSPSTYNAYKSVVGGNDPSAVSVRTTANAKPGTITISRIESVASGATAQSSNVSFKGLVPADNNVKLGDLKFKGGDYKQQDILNAIGWPTGQKEWVFDYKEGSIVPGGLMPGNGLFERGENEISFNINGKTFTFTRNDTLQKMLDTVSNDEQAGVTMTYNRLTDGFKIETKQQNADAQLIIRNMRGNAFGNVEYQQKQGIVAINKTIGGTQYQFSTADSYSGVGTDYVLNPDGTRNAVLKHDENNRYYTETNGVKTWRFEKDGDDYYALDETSGNRVSLGDKPSFDWHWSVLPNPVGSKILDADGTELYEKVDNGHVVRLSDNVHMMNDSTGKFRIVGEDGLPSGAYTLQIGTGHFYELDPVTGERTQDYKKLSVDDEVEVSGGIYTTVGGKRESVYEAEPTTTEGAFKIQMSTRATALVDPNDASKGVTLLTEKVTMYGVTVDAPKYNAISKGSSAVFWVGGTWVGDVNTGGVQVTKDTNEFEADGIYYTLNHATNDATTISVTRDATEPIAKIKGFVDAYNELVKSLRSTTLEKKTTEERKYGALTDDEKAGMSEKEIELWETTAKKGLLYHDSSIEKMLRDLRSSLFTAVSGTGLSPASIGLRTSLYGDLGTIELDESKLRTALEADPERVMKMFTGVAETKNKDGSARSASEIFADNGLLNRISNIFAQYNGTATGTTLANLKTTLDNTNKRIEEMEKAMAKKEESLYLKYAKMEEQLSKLNSQSDWLSGVVAQMNASKK